MEKRTILIVDDDQDNRLLLESELAPDYSILQACDGEEALKMVAKNYPSIVMILLDVRMPKIDGFRVVEILRKKNIMKKIPVILMSTEITLEARIKGYDLGVMDIVIKPLNAPLVKRKVDMVAELYRDKNYLEFVTKAQNKILRQQAEVLRQMSANILDMMSTIVEFRSFETSQHIKRVKAIVRVIGEYVAEYYKEYGLSETEVGLISSASCMHDIGKIMIPDKILQKPGRLTVEEFEVMKSHVLKGCEIIDEVAAYQDETYYKYSYDICKYHHERYDGNGYPEGLKGDDIPIAAQIVSVAEVFDTLICDRVYKEAVSVEEAYLKILDGECGVYSPKILECFKMSRAKIEEIVQEYDGKDN